MVPSGYSPESLPSGKLHLGVLAYVWDLLRLCVSDSIASARGPLMRHKESSRTGKSYCSEGSEGGSTCRGGGASLAGLDRVTARAHNRRAWQLPKGLTLKAGDHGRLNPACVLICCATLATKATGSEARTMKLGRGSDDPRDDPVWETIDVVSELWEQGRFGDTLEQLEGAKMPYGIVPQSFLLELRGRCVMSLPDRGESANEYFQAAIKVCPDNILAWYWMSVHENNLGDHVRALEAANRALSYARKQSIEWPMYTEKGKAPAKLGRAKDACAAFDRATRGGVVNDGDLWRDFGVNLAICGKSTRAFDAMERGMAICHPA